MFDLIASLLAYFYSIVGSYGLAILMLTFLIMVVFTPLIVKSTKSMIAMRDMQPRIKKLQAKYKDDREKLNQETMALYQKHGVNPVGGCLPLFFQAPVFLVLFRVLNGLTRREVDTGFAMGNALTKQGIAIETGNTDIALAISNPADGDCSPLRCFNPEYLEPTSELAMDLRATNKMTSWGIDLSRSASDTLGDSIGASVPYLLLVVAIGILSWYQHHQIQGRNPGAEINPQMQMITKIMPWFLPIFSFTMPAALCVYFVGQSVVRVAQQTFITRRFYGEKEAGAEDDLDDDLDDDDDEPSASVSDDAPAPGGLMGALMGGQSASAAPATASARHGSRSPVSANSKARNRARPPAERASTNGSQSKGAQKSGRTTPKAASTNASAKSNGSIAEESGGMWAKAKRRAGDLGGGAGAESGSSSKAQTSKTKRAGSGSPTSSNSKQSKRVTPKGSTSRSSGTKRK